MITRGWVDPHVLRGIAGSLDRTAHCAPMTVTADADGGAL